jgi:cysteine-rich repeat protein
MTDADCFSHNCIHPVACDEVQVVAPGAGVRDARTAVVAPGPLGGLTSTPAMGKDDPSGQCMIGGAACAINSDCGMNGPCTLGNGIAESLLEGDDQLVVGPGQKSVLAGMQCADHGNFMLCSAIKPGPNGKIDSLRAGDDVIIPGGTGQKLEVSDPLDPDTDMDQISDGNERLLGSSPNLPGDAIFGGDLDKDGLTDVLEGVGWAVQVTACLTQPAGTCLAQPPSRRSVFSNPNLPDTDLDGLPDFAERNMPCTMPPTCVGAVCSNDNIRSCTTASDCENVCPTDPNNPDTDGDGISDFDELSADQFAAITRYNDFFPGYHVDGSTSKQYGTDPTRVDTDGDGLSDFFELFVGWTVVRPDGSVEHVFSDPTKTDTDGDGLPDNQEFAHLTDPGDPDTDGDGRLDGLEVSIGTQPLQPDIFVSVTYSLMQLVGPGDGSEGLNEWRWRLAVQESSQPFPGTALTTERTDCPVDATWPCGAPSSCLTPAGASGAGCDTNRFNFFLNRSIAVALTPNNGIVLNGLIVEMNGFQASDTLPLDVAPVDACRMTFVDQPLTFDAAQSGTFMTRTFQLTGVDGKQPQNCRGLVVAEISVNCIGQAKGFCQAGNPCVTDADCQSNMCAPNPGSNIGTCQAVCGDGVVETGETCDDGNTTSGDGCSATCQIEAGSVCGGMPSVCGTPTATSLPTGTPTATPTPTPPLPTPTPSPTP